MQRRYVRWNVDERCQSSQLVARVWVSKGEDFASFRGKPRDVTQDANPLLNPKDRTDVPLLLTTTIHPRLWLPPLPSA
jgi:hypothetical protein